MIIVRISYTKKTYCYVTVDVSKNNKLPNILESIDKNDNSE